MIDTLTLPVADSLQAISSAIHNLESTEPSITDWIQAASSALGTLGLFLTLWALKVQIDANKWQQKKDVLEKIPEFIIVGHYFDLRNKDRVVTFSLKNIGHTAFTPIIQFKFGEDKHHKGIYPTAPNGAEIEVKLERGWYKQSPNIDLLYQDTFGNNYVYTAYVMYFQDHLFIYSEPSKTPLDRKAR